MGTLIGNQLTNPLPKPDFIEVTEDRLGIHVVETYHASATALFSSLGTIGTNVHASYGVPLQTKKFSRESDKRATLVLTYGPDDPTNNPTGKIIAQPPGQQLTLGVEMAPLIKIHNDYLTDDEKAAKKVDTDGKKTKPMHFAVYTFTEYKTVFSFSESYISANLSPIGTPPSISGATAYKWRFAGREVRKQGQVTQDAQVWEFRPWLES